MANSVSRFAQNLVTVGILAASLVACQKGKSQQPAGAASASAMPANELESFLKNDSAPLTADLYE